MAELNGEPVELAQLQNLALTNYGHFTSMRVDDGRVRGLSLHMERLQRDCRTLFGTDLDLQRVRELARRAAPATGSTTVRVTIFDPSLDLGHPAAAKEPHVLVTSRPAGTLPLPPLRVQSATYVRDVPSVKSVGLFASVRLHPDDRELTSAEWAEVGHRLARVTGIVPPGDEQACRWIAIRDRSHRLDLLANLIREDGNWAVMPAQVLHVLAAECRRVEADLGLLSPRDHHAGPFQQHTSAMAQTASDMLDPGRVVHLSDEANRHLAAARRLVEKAAQQLGTPPSNAPGLAHQLEWIARRAHALESDLAEITPRRPRTAAGGPAARLPASLPSARAARTR